MPDREEVNIVVKVAEKTGLRHSAKMMGQDRLKE